MRKQWQKNGLQSALLAVVLVATAAQAERDTFGLGTGRSGAFTAPAGSSVINAYTQVTAPLAPGDTTITTSGTVVGAGTFTAGDLVMVVQTTGIVPEPPSGGAGPIDLSTSPVGRWEFARLADVSGGTLTLTASLIHSYAGDVTQVIRVPEYTTVTVDSGNSITAQPWNGSTGGIIAFLATGTVDNAGSINADELGLRGGMYVRDTINRTGCTELDQSATTGGAQKGEGIAAGRYGSTSTGRGNLANAGGGGVCSKSGGGGGGNAGAGGIGGRSNDGDRVIGGLGGAQVVYSLVDRLMLGGGGGAGHGTGNNGTFGGHGGGIIFIRAQQFDGAGTISANGQSASLANLDAAGGGGAGGSIHLRAAGSFTCGGITVIGGNGGNVTGSRIGPGGGGGGGRVLLQGSTIDPACGGNTNTDGASPGSQTSGTAPDGRPFGAQPGNDGNALILPGGFIQPTVAITTPANGSRINNPRPTIVGTATPNSTVSLLLNGTEVGPVTADASGNYSLALTSDLAAMQHTLQARADFQGMSSPVATSTFTVDLTPPDTRIDSGPSGPTNSAAATFTFSSPASDVARYECSRDGTNYTTCTSPLEYTGLAEGSYTFYVRAVDSAGNVDTTPESRTWTVDLTVPDTRIDSNPPALTNSRDARFTFSSPSADVARYECRLGSAAFATCTSPIDYTSLADGSYTFQVKAIDSAGNEDPTPAQYTWTVDSTPPPAPVVVTPANGSRTTDTTPTLSGTAEPNSTVTVYVDDVPARVLTADGSGNWSFDSADLLEGQYTVYATATDAANNTSVRSNTNTFFIDLTEPTTIIVSKPAERSNSPSATFDFSSNESPVTYECSLDNGAFTLCSDPVTFNSLAEGNHTLRVRAVDGAGNRDSTPETYTWTVDLTPPETTIVSGPPSPTNSTEAMFDFSSNESPVTYECSLNGAAFAPCSDPVTLTNLTEREHTLRVRAVDAAGNVDPTPASYTWTVDRTPPAAPTVTAPADGAEITTTRRPVYSGTAAPGSTVTVIVDGTPIGTAVADASGNWSLPAPADLANGTYMVRATARDAAGNISPDSITNTFTVNTPIPSTPVILTPPNGAIINNPRPVISGTAEPNNTVRVYLNGELVGTVPSDAAGNWTFTPNADLEGNYTLEATATNNTGNTSGPAQGNFFVDLTPPETRIISGPPAQTDSTRAEFDFNSEELATFECSLDGAAFTACTDPMTYTDLALGTHTLQVRAKDRAGNVDPTPAEYTWIITAPPDTTSPETTIVSGPPTESSSAEATFDFSSSESPVTYECSLDGGAFVACNDPVTFQGLSEGPHTLAVRAVDAAGNRDSTPATYTWTVQGPKDTSFLGDGLGCSATPGRDSNPALALLGLLMLVALGSRRR
jgi:large repetitive protein